MSPASKSLLCLAALALAGLVLTGTGAAAAPTAAAKTTPATRTTTTAKQTTTGKTTTAKQTSTAPAGKTGKKCWNDLIRDWYDGRIDNTYAVHCYQDALKHLPADVKTYSDAYDVISRALADATRGKKHVDPDEPVPPPSGPSTGGSSFTGGASGGGGSSAGGPIGGGLNQGDRGANGIPVPLMILGGLALLLVAAGGIGLATRHLQNRRGGPGTF